MGKSESRFTENKEKDMQEKAIGLADGSFFIALCFLYEIKMPNAFTLYKKDSDIQIIRRDFHGYAEVDYIWRFCRNGRVLRF